MNTFWLKIAGLAVLIIGVIVLINVFSGSEAETAPEPKSKPRTIYEQWDEDDKRLRAQPGPVEAPRPASPAEQRAESQPVETRQPEFEKLSLEQEVEARRLWEWVVNQRKMGRLPVMGYGQMVKTCREIIQRWPASEYAFKAKRALADLPERYHKMYNITKEETDVSSFYR
jgi:type IV secretory pathway VirB10-like protein